LYELEAAAARVCLALGDPGFREIVDRAGATGTLDRIVVALTTDGPAAPAGLADDLVLLNDQLTRYGLDGLTESTRDYRPLPGAPGHPVVEVFRCPHERCGRIDAGPHTAADPPWCAAAGRPLRVVRLPT
jgi:hypothetical protein